MAAGIGFLLSSGAWGQTLPPAAADEAGDHVPFHFRGVEWQNQKAFIDAGRRCATRHPDEIKARQVERALREFRVLWAQKQGNGKGKPGGGGGGGGGGDSRP
ncbi:hypothetical protein HQ590_14165, partial [bacterium]|nr:hypothetical protein [bacterium]